MRLYMNPNRKIGHINPEIYGHFSEHLGRCIYEGIFVGEDSEIPNVKGMRIDVVNALREMKIPVLRWPGGCFADEYHWKDGIGPKEDRKRLINTHWGGVVEDNSFGSDEFMEFCKQIGSKTYINGNLGSGTVQEMSEWVEYLTYGGVSPMAELRKKNGHEEPYQVDYFAVGNENWGCGGNMTPEYYGNLYRRYQTYVRNYHPDKPIYKIACGPNVDDYEWMREVLHTTHRHAPDFLHGFMDGISLHYYTIPGGWENKQSATVFDERSWYETLNRALYIETLIKRHGEILRQYDPTGNIGLIVDEWGTWFACEPGTNPGFLYQQNTMRDALVAGISLNVFNKQCNLVKMANIAQLVNVLQSVILTEGDQMLLTPTYHVFHMYQHHQNSDLIDSYIETKTIGLDERYMVPNLSESVSIGEDENLYLTLNNLSLEEAYEIEGIVADKKVVAVTGTILTENMDAHNTFQSPDTVTTKNFDGAKITEEGIKLTIPPCSVVAIKMEIE